MLSRFKQSAVLSVLVFLTACGPPQPQYRTDFQLVPPPTENGRMCASNGVMAKQNCAMSCNLQSQQCELDNRRAAQDAERDARRRYNDYVRERQSQGKLIKKDMDDFRYSSSQDCSTAACAAMCEENFRLHYTTCGGQVIPRTYCVSNCHLIPPAAAPMTAGR